MADSYKVFDKSPIVDDAVSIHGHSFKKREIALGAVALLALVVCVILAAVLATKVSSDSGAGGGRACGQTGGSGMCLDPICMKSAAVSVQSMNATISPCQDFHAYACGNWYLQNPLKPDVSQLTPAWNIYYENEVKLRRLMETPSSNLGRISNERKLKDFFASCTDHYGGMSRQGRPFLNMVVQESGGWYVTGSFNPATYDFKTSLQKTHVDYWTDAFFTFSLKTDWLDWRKIIVEMLVKLSIFTNYQKMTQQ